MVQVMEQIHVRLTGADREQVLESLAGNGREDIRVYRHTALGTDFCVQILWNTEGAPNRSDLGLRLAAGLSEVGTVHHTLWIANGKRR